MNNAVEIGEKGVTVHLAGGGRVVLGAWGYDTSTAANPQPPLTPDEEKYGAVFACCPLVGRSLVPVNTGKPT